ncbi:uncharacterized protein CDV56_107795 [Aspergillus thermomutatus]|uniref:BRCT domain-containing protein n=1 Tax=Aspergillus thermomutatus TaxID=41047 RepID=A0A397HI05_ASPTH|nr:uncharacterized protein CDV56_107795 [Aspergillus thermomutatus]RHZ60120.1 hypothetical protein CDV56_107795 [Aspergillus thermomutatus]
MARAAIIPKSSPKRTTRGRPPASTVKAAGVTAASKPVARTARTKTGTSATETRKRTTRTATATSVSSKQPDSDTEEATDDELGVIDTKEKAKLGRPKGKSSTSSTSATGRGRRPATPAAAECESDNDEDELAQTDAPKKRPGRPRTKPLPKEDEVKPETAPRPRGRPRATAATKPAATTAADKNSTKKKTRAQTGAAEASRSGSKHAVITTNSTAMRSNLLRGPAKKKTVTFKDVSDSEDEDAIEPAPATTGRRRAATTASGKVGLGAKPVRKPATTTVRGRKPAVSKKEANKPLSPKKANQVAKSISSYVSSDGEDDELSSVKDQIKLVINSPLKQGSETTGLSSPVRKINFTPRKFNQSVDENGEPTLQPTKAIDFSDSLFMSSPARRPTPSPFHYTVKETPRRARLSFRGNEKSIAQPSLTPTQNSPLKASPKKAHLETPRHGGLGLREEIMPLSQPNFTPGHNSPLKSSPKKGIFGVSFTQAPLQESSTPFKSRSLLLQSPAKRIASPFKNSLFSSVRSMPELHQNESRRDHVTAADEANDADDVEHVESSLRTPEPEGRIEVDYGDEGMDQDDEMEQESSEEHHVVVSPAHCVDSHNMNDDQQTESIAPDDVENTREQLSDHDDVVDKWAGDSLDDHVEDARRESAENLRAYELVDEDPEVDCEEPGDVAFDAEAAEYHAESLAEEEPRVLDDNHSEEGSEIDENDGHPAEESTVGHAASVSNMDTHAEQIGLASDYDEAEDPDATESEPEEEHMIQDAYGREVQAMTEESSLPFQRHSLGGLEDVFTDAAVADEGVDGESDTDPVAETMASAALKGDVQPDELHDEYVDFHDSEFFDDNEATLVAFYTTDHYIYDVQPDAQPNAQSDPQLDAQQGLERVNSPIHGQDRSLLSQVSTTHDAIAYHGNMDYQEEEDVSESEFTTDIQSYSFEHNDRPESSTSAAVSNHYPESGSLMQQKRPRFTLLAEQLSQWKASSPEKAQPKRPGRGVFSIGGLRRSSRRGSRIAQEVAYPDIEDRLVSPWNQASDHPRDSEIYAGVPEIYEDQDDQELDESHADAVATSSPQREPMTELFSEPQPEFAEPTAYEEFLNRQPAHASDLAKSPVVLPSSLNEDNAEENKENKIVELPAPVTPIKQKNIPLQTFHTVSKVPLKPEGQVSPLKLSRKRGRSLSITSPVRSSPRLRKPVFAPQEQSTAQTSPRKMPKLQHNETPRSQKGDSRRKSVSSQSRRRSVAPSASPSPSKTPRRNIAACENVLGGAVVYVDVHTTEGEDASGIFIELLQQMGARCVKSWGWNPRASMSSADMTNRRDSKVGITHVVFKDGGVRTLEKVRQAAGLVKCVGVGWVLDCERENKWLDETHYAVDSSIIPRGGAKRRKSMEPRALSNVNGTLIKADNTASASASGRRSGADFNTMDDFMRQTPPLSQGEPSTPESNRKYTVTHTEADQRYCQTPKSPDTSGYDFSRMDNIGMSPATPFYLSQRSRLVQQTCPPKQIRQGLFSTSSSVDDEPTQKLRFKLEAARRKSLAFKPKVGSPLIN